MKYRRTLIETLQIVQSTKLVWLFGLIIFLCGFVENWESDSLSMQGLNTAILCISILLIGFSDFGTIKCTDKVMRGDTPKFKEIWQEFNTIFGRYALLYILLIILFIPIFFSLNLAAKLLSSGSYVFGDAAISIWSFVYILAPVFLGISRFSYFGLVLEKLPVLKSLKHGLSVLLMNFLPYSILFSFFKSHTFLHC